MVKKNKLKEKNLDNQIKNKFIHSKIFFNFVLFALFLIVLIQVFLVKPPLTGSSILLIDREYSKGDKISGSVKFVLDEQDIIPEIGKLIIYNGDERKEFLISDLVNGSYIKNGGEMIINLSKLNLDVKEGEFIVSFLYKDTEIASLEEKILIK